MTGFDDWLTELHGRMATPPALVDRVVRKATGRGLASLERLIVGQVNEVYCAEIDDGRQVIVRISHADDPRFEGERWALDAAREAGVPTPTVLHLEHVPPVHFCVEEQLPGVPLDAALGRGEATGAIDEVGELLARIHSVPVDGFGYLQPDGRGWPIGFGDIMLDLLPQHDRVISAAAHWSIPSSQVERGLELLAEYAGLYVWETPRLVHGDFAADHILVDGDRISGILDMQECFGGHPIFDIVHWNSVASDRIATKVLLRSYGQSAIFDATYEPLFHLVLLRSTLHMLIVRIHQNNPHAIDRHRRELAHCLAFFE